MVLKTTSPVVLPLAPIDWPRKIVPSASASTAGTLIKSPYFARGQAAAHSHFGLLCPPHLTIGARRAESSAAGSGYGHFRTSDIQSGRSSRRTSSRLAWTNPYSDYGESLRSATAGVHEKCGPRRARMGAETAAHNLLSG